MKVGLVAMTGVPLGKHKVKDPRLDQADKLVKADNKSYAFVDVVGDEEASTADAIVASPEGRFDLIVKDLEFVQTRLERNPPVAENAVLERIKAHLESEGVVAEAGLTPEELHLIESHAFVTAKPIVVAEAADSATSDNFWVQVVSAGGIIGFLGVGGWGNRAWLIRRGSRAKEGGGATHTDIKKGFIGVEIMGYDDFVAGGGKTQAKHANKGRVETKSYV